MGYKPVSVDGCVFCEIVADTSKGEVIRDYSTAICIEPLNPVVPGHVIVISKDHVTDFADDPRVSMWTMYYASYHAMLTGGEWNLITSKGEAATQSIFHLHIHLVPRVVGDGLKLPWTGQVKT